MIAGIEDYGNKMVFPTVNGAFFYDPGFTANPLVFCDCLASFPTARTVRRPRLAIWLWCWVAAWPRRAARRGFLVHGDGSSNRRNRRQRRTNRPSNPREASPEAVLLAGDEHLYTAITDCGAGGLSSAVGEMVKDLGATASGAGAAEVSRPAPWEIWLSEAQERMVLAVPPTSGRVCRLGAPIWT